MVLQIVAYDVKVTTHKQQQGHAGICLGSNLNTLGVGLVIQQRPMYQKLTFHSDTTAHPRQSYCALRTTGRQLCFPPICKLVQEFH